MCAAWNLIPDVHCGAWRGTLPDHYVFRAPDGTLRVLTPQELAQRGQT